MKTIPLTEQDLSAILAALSHLQEVTPPAIGIPMSIAQGHILQVLNAGDQATFQRVILDGKRIRDSLSVLRQ